MLPHEIEAEKVAFKSLSFKDKIDHIWTYYKFPIIIGLCVLFVIGWCINYWFINPPKKSDSLILLYTYYDDEELVDSLRTDLNSHFAEKMQSNHQIEMQVLLNYEDSFQYYEQNMAASQKLSAMIYAAELDVLISNKTVLDTFANNVSSSSYSTEADVYLKKLSDVFSPEEMDLLTSAGYVVSPYILSVGADTSLSSIMGSQQDPYLGFIINAPHASFAKEVVLYLLHLSE